MSYLLRRWAVFQGRRCMSTSPQTATVREQLLAAIKNAMKTKDTVAATTFRSVLSEVYAADKTDPSGKVPPSSVVSILRKAKQRRFDTAQKYTEAQRNDLAEKEMGEVSLIDTLLPPLLPEAEIDAQLQMLMREQSVDAPRKQRQGELIKAFYKKVDRGIVDPALVAQRATALLQV